MPYIQTLQDCSSYAKVVEPGLEQLRELPGAIVHHISAILNGESVPTLLELYQSTDPLVSGATLSLALGVVFFVVSEINRNYSQVDRCWSLLPTVYVGHYSLWAHLNNVPSRRLDLALVVAVIWSVRLTLNYARKGGYTSGSEDYRWEIIRATIPVWFFHVFNLTFISFMQSILLFLLSVPAYTIMLANEIEKEVQPADAACVAILLGLIIFESMADEQQWRYQAAKKQYLETAKVPDGFTRAAMDRGFLVEGLWAHSRHPNFAAEQSIWLALYQWSCFACDSIYSYAGVGAASLVLLFQGSTWLTESITAKKYPEYKAYQKQVGMFVPTWLKGYRASPARGAAQPKVIRTSELAKKQKKEA